MPKAPGCASTSRHASASPCFSRQVLPTPPNDPTGTATCSALSAELAEPLPGTAAVTGCWLCLEQRGPWGRSAATQSRLDPELGAELADRGERAGVRLQLIRRPGPHADVPGPRRVYLANTNPDNGWLRRADLEDPAELLKLDFARIAAGHHDDWGRPDPDPLLLVCTNGRRDRCCAVQGRALVSELAGRHVDSVWETTHTGGHRFAPAAVLLPSGYTYGRISAHDAEAVLSAAATGKLALEGCRGRSTFSRAGQAAELAVRRAFGEYLVDALQAEEIEAGEIEDALVRVRHRDGRQWTVPVTRSDPAITRPTSCGAVESLPDTWVAGSVFAER